MCKLITDSQEQKNATRASWKNSKAGEKKWKFEREKLKVQASLAKRSGNALASREIEKKRALDVEIPLINPSPISNKLENFNFIFIYSIVLRVATRTVDTMIMCGMQLLFFFLIVLGAAAFELGILAVPFWGIFVRIFRFILGWETWKTVGLADCRFDCSLHRCQLATVRLAAFQWYYRWCFRSSPL